LLFMMLMREEERERERERLIWVFEFLKLVEHNRRLKIYNNKICIWYSRDDYHKDYLKRCTYFGLSWKNLCRVFMTSSDLLESGMTRRHLDSLESWQRLLIRSHPFCMQLEMGTICSGICCFEKPGGSDKVHENPILINHLESLLVNQKDISSASLIAISTYFVLFFSSNWCSPWHQWFTDAVSLSNHTHILWLHLSCSLDLTTGMMRMQFVSFVMKSSSLLIWHSPRSSS
jgi:hypothetical protein